MIWNRLLVILLMIFYVLFIWATWTLLIYFVKWEYNKFPNKKLIDLALTLLSVFWPITITSVLLQIVVFNIKKICKRSR